MTLEKQLDDWKHLNKMLKQVRIFGEVSKRAAFKQTILVNEFNYYRRVYEKTYLVKYEKEKRP